MNTLYIVLGILYIVTNAFLSGRFYEQQTPFETTREKWVTRIFCFVLLFFGILSIIYDRLYTFFYSHDVLQLRFWWRWYFGDGYSIDKVKVQVLSLLKRNVQLLQSRKIEWWNIEDRMYIKTANMLLEKHKNIPLIGDRVRYIHENDIIDTVEYIDEDFENGFLFHPRVYHLTHYAFECKLKDLVKADH